MSMSKMSGAWRSFGLMHRMYEGSFDPKIVISLLREFLNCVIAVSGRFLEPKDGQLNSNFKCSLKIQISKVR